jgi:hypothetical protein
MSYARSAMLAAIALAAVAPPVLAQPGMGMIGRRLVADTAERETIPVTGSDHYGTLMICVDDAPIRFQEIVVRYKDGSARNVRLRALVAAGRCSREIELGGRRELAGVEIAYQAASLGGGRAVVQLFGR